MVKMHTNHHQMHKLKLSHGTGVKNMQAIWGDKWAWGRGEGRGWGGGEGAGGQFKTAWSFGKYMVSTASCRYSNLENNELVPHHFDLVQHMFHGIFLNQSEIYSVIL